MWCISVLTKLEFSLETQHCPLEGTCRSASFKQLTTHQHERGITSNHGLHTPQSQIEARKTVLFASAIAPLDPTLLWANNIPNTRASEVVTELFHDSALSPPRSGTTQSGGCLGDNAAQASAHVQWPPESDVVAVSARLEPPGHAIQHMTMA